MATLTKRQKQIYDYIKKYIRKKGISPTFEEIKKHLRLKALSTISEHIEELVEKGFITKNGYGARSIELADNKKFEHLEIPLLGTIAAGQPIDAIENHGETITLARSEIGNFGQYYALRVQGQSMIDEGIFDGDTVIIKKQNTAENGQTVVAIIDENEATLKKIYREKNRFRLQPANQTLLPLFRKEVEIRGVVVKIIRELEPVQKSEGELSKIIKSFSPTLNSHRKPTSAPNEKAKPFLQWIGGKREMISQYEKFIPKKFNSYFEPFLGGGAMFFHLQPKNSILSDNNTELIKTYEGVRDDPEKVIKILKELKMRHSKDLYLKIRNIDRDINIFTELDTAEMAARMIYLNQTCFNGLYRVNMAGQFNVPIGSSLNRLICDENTIHSASKVLKKVSLRETDFELALKDAGKDDFIYLDPPYYPISIYSDFTRYTKEKFYKEDQIRLKSEIDKLTRRGCKVMLSNSDCQFLRELYPEYNKNKVFSSRSLNCKKDKRGKISELLITNY